MYASHEGAHDTRKLRRVTHSSTEFTRIVNYKYSHFQIRRNYGFMMIIDVKHLYAQGKPDCCRGDPSPRYTRKSALCTQAHFVESINFTFIDGRQKLVPTSLGGSLRLFEFVCNDVPVFANKRRALLIPYYGDEFIRRRKNLAHEAERLRANTRVRAGTLITARAHAYTLPRSTTPRILPRIVS
ncbi:hypothetical protein EVAR_10730_1 [Eumeta japonica]|uniref:Uncharacterized protein n=1 Tax=Eumeta variegata TaxID=151549 RepID=A0A4C1U7Z5_EUMVA|nr:hypothetical protein EVAR_10730_1 [Eumeta japonica]